MTEPIHKLGEVLRTARESKGVDLDRAERDTKIRVRYLSALERGEYRELPGSVYTKGFLRNYAAYLGLDPEYLVDLYRLETATVAERRAMPAPPRPLEVRRSRAFVVTPGAVVTAILTILVGLFVAYLGIEFVTFAGTPELRIIDPAGDVAAFEEREYTLRGVTAPNARVTVDGLAENPIVTADEQGNFEVHVELVPGSNVITITASDPVTRRDSEPRTRTINVVTAVDTPAPVALTLSEPAADAALAAPVPMRGTAAPGAEVTVAATPTAAGDPGVTVTDGAGQPVALSPQPAPAPEPQTWTAGADGAFAGELPLAPGSWELTISAGEEELTRNVTITASPGLSGRLDVRDQPSYLELTEDDVPAERSGGIIAAGDSVEMGAERSLRILAGNAGAVHVTLNGVPLGAMGAAGAVVEWQITAGE